MIAVRHSLFVLLCSIAVLEINGCGGSEPEAPMPEGFHTEPCEATHDPPGPCECIKFDSSYWDPSTSGYTADYTACCKKWEAQDEQCLKDKSERITGFKDEWCDLTFCQVKEDCPLVDGNAWAGTEWEDADTPIVWSWRNCEAAETTAGASST